jgi:hypothetical protein
VVTVSSPEPESVPVAEDFPGPGRDWVGSEPVLAGGPGMRPDWVDAEPGTAELLPPGDAPVLVAAYSCARRSRETRTSP